MATFGSTVASSWAPEVASFNCAWHVLPGVAFEKVVSRPLGLREAMNICEREPCDALTRVEGDVLKQVNGRQTHWRLMRGQPRKSENVLSLGYNCGTPRHRRFDFVETGTSDFDSLAQEVATVNGTVSVVGLSVEPVLTHLATLPFGEQQHLALAAAGAADGWATVHYLDPSEITANQELPWWLRGCSTVGRPHPTWAKMDIPASAYRTDIVPVYSIATLFRLHGVAAVDRFQIDVEGAEAMVLGQLLAAARSNPSLWPEEVRFAADELSNITDRWRFQRFWYIMRREGYFCFFTMPGTHHDVVCRLKVAGFAGALQRLIRAPADQATWFRRALWLCHNCTIPPELAEGVPMLEGVILARQRPERSYLLDVLFGLVINRALQAVLWLGVRSDTMELQMSWRAQSDALWMTADPNPAAAQFGSSEHHCVLELEQLPADCLPTASADIIFLDQAAVTRPEAAPAIFTALLRTLSPAGTLVFGRASSSSLCCAIPLGFRPIERAKWRFKVYGAGSVYIYDLLQKR